MAVSRISASDIHIEDQSYPTYSASQTVPAGASLAVLLMVGYENGSGLFSGSSISLGGTPMTYIESTDAQAVNGQTGIFYLKNPVAGSKTLSITWGANFTEGIVMVLCFYQGSDNTTPIRDHKNNVTDGGTISGLTTLSGDMTVGCVYSYNNATSGHTDGQTLIWDQTIVYRQDNSSYAEKSNSSTWKFTGGAFTTCSAIVIKAAAAAPLNWLKSNYWWNNPYNLG